MVINMKENFETEVLTRLAVIESKLDDYKEIKDKTDIAYNKSIDNEKDINEINDKLKWLSRALVSAIIVAIITVIFTYLKMGLGIN